MPRFLSNLYVLICVIYTRKYSDGRDLEILTDLRVLRSLEHESMGISSVCMYICRPLSARMRASLALERLNGFYSYTVFKSLSTTRPDWARNQEWLCCRSPAANYSPALLRSEPGEHERSSSRNMGLSEMPSNTKYLFCRKWLILFWLDFGSLWGSSP
jgi:hypothetical protein